MILDHELRHVYNPNFTLCALYTKGKVISGTDQVPKQHFRLVKIKAGLLMFCAFNHAVGYLLTKGMYQQ